MTTWTPSGARVWVLEILTSVISWWYNYLPVPEASVHNKWWCMYPDQTPFTPDARPEGEER